MMGTSRYRSALLRASALSLIGMLALSACNKLGLADPRTIPEGSMTVMGPKRPPVKNVQQMMRNQAPAAGQENNAQAAPNMVSNDNMAYEGGGAVWSANNGWGGATPVAAEMPQVTTPAPMAMPVSAAVPAPTYTPAPSAYAVAPYAAPSYAASPYGQDPMSLQLPESYAAMPSNDQFTVPSMGGQPYTPDGYSPVAMEDNYGNAYPSDGGAMEYAALAPASGVDEGFDTNQALGSYMLPGQGNSYAPPAPYRPESSEQEDRSHYEPSAMPEYATYGDQMVRNPYAPPAPYDPSGQVSSYYPTQPQSYGYEDFSAQNPYAQQGQANGYSPMLNAPSYPVPPTPMAAPMAGYQGQAQASMPPMGDYAVPPSQSNYQPMAPQPMQQPVPHPMQQQGMPQNYASYAPVNWQNPNDPMTQRPVMAAPVGGVAQRSLAEIATPPAELPPALPAAAPATANAMASLAPAAAAPAAMPKKPNSSPLMASISAAPTMKPMGGFGRIPAAPAPAPAAPVPAKPVAATPAPMPAAPIATMAPAAPAVAPAAAPAPTQMASLGAAPAAIAAVANAPTAPVTPAVTPPAQKPSAPYAHLSRIPLEKPGRERNPSSGFVAAAPTVEAATETEYVMADWGAEAGSSAARGMTRYTGINAAPEAPAPRGSALRLNPPRDAGYLPDSRYTRGRRAY